MPLKHRLEPMELKVLRSLNNRMELTEIEKSYYVNFEKGFAGEKKFDEWMEEFLDENCLALNDLLLERKNSVFQIDSLLITWKKIYLFEIKNYEGDYYIEDDKWYTLTGIEINNPLSQINRSESLLRGLLQELGFNYPIESYVIFVNPHFFMYQAPRNLPLIFPPQLQKFKAKLLMNTGKLNKSHSVLASKLISLHLFESPYTRLPKYDYSSLEKGVTCASCHMFLEILKSKGETITCKKCGHKERTCSAILRSTEEFNMLFPERKITTNEIYEWCNAIRPKRFIREVLSEKYKLVGRGKSSCFIKTELEQ